MSAALGGEVRPAARPEYGWTSITSSTEHIAPGPWFQFHHDEFTLPPGAVELGRNESGIQAFRARRALATQFHPEMTGDLLASWCVVEDGAKELIDAGHDPDRLIEECRLKAIESQPALEEMLDWFVDDMTTPLLTLDDPEPLTGDGHAFFSINNWQSDTWFDNLRIAPAAGGAGAAAPAP